MTKSGVLVGLCIAVAVGAGCASQSQMLDTRQSAAVQTALERGRFDLNCPSATATVLSRDYIQPAIQGPWVAGLQRVEYTIGVEGCTHTRPPTNRSLHGSMVGAARASAANTGAGRCGWIAGSRVPDARRDPGC